MTVQIKKLLLCASVGTALFSTNTIAYADFISDFLGSHQKNSEVQRLKQTTVEALRSSDIWQIDRGTVTVWKISERKGTLVLQPQNNGRQPFVANQVENIGTAMRRQGKISLQKPVRIVPNKDGSINVFYGAKNAVEFNVRMLAYDVSGQAMSKFLRTKNGEPSADAERVGRAVFPQGSIAYLPKTHFVRNELVLPMKESFMGANTRAELIRNFSKKVPYCLSYEYRSDAKAYGILFDNPNPKAKNGTFTVVPVKSDSLFCQMTNEKPVGKGKWNYIHNKETGAIVLTLPKEIDVRDAGLTPLEKDAAQIAFIEPVKGDVTIRPGKLYRAGQPINDGRYRFNEIAGRAIKKAANL